MKIRSVTCFIPADETLAGAALDRAGTLNQQARATAADAGLILQTTRIAAQPLAQILQRTPALEFARLFERTYRNLGFDYGALVLSSANSNRSDPSHLERVRDGVGSTTSTALYAHAAELVRSTESVFVSLSIASKRDGIDLDAIRAAAAAIVELGQTTAAGLGNFRFAAAANVPPGVPFFPTAYAGDGEPTFALATQAADLAVDAFTDAPSLDAAQARLVNAIETHAARLDEWSRALERASGVQYAGIDFSLAPHPTEQASLATALERLTGARFGTRGTLFAASFVTDTLRRARFTRAGFSTLMLPMLEDWTMARRSHENLYTLDSLLLYSAVCGTGLDTIPLAGSTTQAEIAALLLDLAALALKLDKPLTARLIPVPGVAAGASTQFQFEHFANARAFAINADPALKLLPSFLL